MLTNMIFPPQTAFSDEELVEKVSFGSVSVFSAGQMLKEARLKKNLSLVQISKTLHICQSTLSDLEEGDWLKHKTERTFMLGFARSYAKFLGLDVQQILFKMKGDSGNIVPEKEVDVLYPLAVIQQPSRTFPSFFFFSVALVMCATLFIFGTFWKDRGKEGLEYRSLFDDTTIEESQSTPTSSELTLERLLQEAPGDALKKVGGVRRIIATEDSWIKIQTPQGNTVFEGVSKKGTKKTFSTPGKRYILSTHNIKGLTFDTQDSASFSLKNAESASDSTVLMSVS